MRQIQCGTRHLLITTIVFCRERPVHRAPKITYIHIPSPDSRPISAQEFEDIMFAMAIGVRRGNLLVHCLAGMSRSPILIAAWLDRCGYAEIDKALSQIAELRDLAPSRALLQSVKDLLSCKQCRLRVRRLCDMIV
jgi:atypical dual specificity phosphatase